MQQPVGPDSLRFLGQFSPMAGIVAARSRNYGHPAFDGFNGKFDDRHMLIIRHGRGLACGSTDHDGIGTSLDLELDLVSQRGIVDTHVGKRSHNSRRRADK